MPASFKTASRPGQIAIVMVIVIMVFMMTMFPVFDMFMKNESKWSMKEKKDTAAFHQAEAGIDRAKWKLLETSDMWTKLSSATIEGYNFDRVYTDIGGGSYAIKMSSHPTNADQRVFEAVGRDASNTEVRRLKVILENSNNANFATRAQNQVANTGGNDHIEWGPVISGNNIDATGRTFPRYFSAGHVTPQDGGSTASNTDNIYWWSYYPVPPTPNIDFAFYLASATASGNAPNGCGNGNSSKYYHVGNAEFKGCKDTSNRTYYITGSLEFQSGGGGNFIKGTIIALGNISISGNGGADGAYHARLPPEAWREYGNNWAHYKTFDPGAPATFAAAAASSYQALNKTYYLNNVLLHGFLYTGGNQGLVGGGNCNINGSLYSANNATMGTSTMGIYYDDSVTSSLRLTGVNIRQAAWYEVKGEWPAIP
jgi:hypothetical protein